MNIVHTQLETVCWVMALFFIVVTIFFLFLFTIMETGKEKREKFTYYNSIERKKEIEKGREENEKKYHVHVPLTLDKFHNFLTEEILKDVQSSLKKYKKKYLFYRLTEHNYTHLVFQECIEGIQYSLTEKNEVFTLVIHPRIYTEDVFRLQVDLINQTSQVGVQGEWKEEFESYPKFSQIKESINEFYDMHSTLVFSHSNFHMEMWAYFREYFSEKQMEQFRCIFEKLKKVETQLKELNNPLEAQLLSDQILGKFKNLFIHQLNVLEKEENQSFLLFEKQIEELLINRNQKALEKFEKHQKALKERYQ